MSPVRRRPLVVIPARFSASAAALRYRAVVTARALSEAVLEAGGEPLTVHPWAPGGMPDAATVGDRLRFADAVLLPGGGDVDPSRYGQSIAVDDVYGVDGEQDSFDFAVAEWALREGVPMLAVCRGMQVVNVVLGGSLQQHMRRPHRHVVHPVATTAGSHLRSVVGPSVTASCFHHQCLDRIAVSLVATARAVDGTVEGVERPAGPGWFLGVQWHPEDTVSGDPVQLEVVRSLVRAAG